MDSWLHDGFKKWIDVDIFVSTMKERQNKSEVRSLESFWNASKELVHDWENESKEDVKEADIGTRKWNGRKQKTKI